MQPCSHCHHCDVEANMDFKGKFLTLDGSLCPPSSAQALELNCLIWISVSSQPLLAANYHSVMLDAVLVLSFP